MQSCKKILIIWNDQDRLRPQIDYWPESNITISIIKTLENRLTNRFYPYEEILTDAVLSIDDDISMLTPDELEFGYQTWRQMPDRLVGYPARQR